MFLFVRHGVLTSCTFYCTVIWKYIYKKKLHLCNKCLHCVFILHSPCGSAGSSVQRWNRQADRVQNQVPPVHAHSQQRRRDHWSRSGHQQVFEWGALHWRRWKGKLMTVVVRINEDRSLQCCLLGVRRVGFGTHLHLYAWKTGIGTDISIVSDWQTGMVLLNRYRAKCDLCLTFEQRRWRSFYVFPMFIPIRWLDCSDLHLHRGFSIPESNNFIKHTTCKNNKRGSLSSRYS